LLGLTETIEKRGLHDVVRASTFFARTLYSELAARPSGWVDGAGLTNRVGNSGHYFLKGGLGMKKSIINVGSLLLIILGISMPSVALQLKQIGWQDLVKKVEFEDPFEALTEDQLFDLGLVARVRQLQDAGRQVGEETLNEIQGATLRLEKDGVDINELLARRTEIIKLRQQRASAVVEDLNGQTVRMPGYALPLEYDGMKVKEFLLVPWVGACIHTPPPPPNQIVYVEAMDAFQSDSRFEPVWIEGVMRVGDTSKELFLVDGSSDIQIGYSMKSVKIEKYRKAP
jgi:hypothetical protein